jgi:hypothetical protein
VFVAWRLFFPINFFAHVNNCCSRLPRVLFLRLLADDAPNGSGCNGCVRCVPLIVIVELGFERSVRGCRPRVDERLYWQRLQHACPVGAAAKSAAGGRREPATGTLVFIVVVVVVLRQRDRERARASARERHPTRPTVAGGNCGSERRQSQGSKARLVPGRVSTQQHRCLHQRSHPDRRRAARLAHTTRQSPRTKRINIFIIVNFLFNSAGGTATPTPGGGVLTPFTFDQVRRCFDALFNTELKHKISFLHTTVKWHYG